MFYGLYKGKKLIEASKNRNVLFDIFAEKEGFCLFPHEELRKELKPLGYRISKVKIIEIK